MDEVLPNWSQNDDGGEWDNIIQTEEEDEDDEDDEDEFDIEEHPEQIFDLMRGLVPPPVILSGNRAVPQVLNSLRQRVVAPVIPVHTIHGGANVQVHLNMPLNVSAVLGRRPTHVQIQQIPANSFANINDSGPNDALSSNVQIDILSHLHQISPRFPFVRHWGVTSSSSTLFHRASGDEPEACRPRLLAINRLTELPARSYFNGTDIQNSLFRSHAAPSGSMPSIMQGPAFGRNRRNQAVAMEAMQTQVASNWGSLTHRSGGDLSRVERQISTLCDTEETLPTVPSTATTGISNTANNNSYVLFLFVRGSNAVDRQQQMRLQSQSQLQAQPISALPQSRAVHANDSQHRSEIPTETQEQKESVRETTTQTQTQPQHANADIFTLPPEIRADASRDAMAQTSLLELGDQMERSGAREEIQAVDTVAQDTDIVMSDRASQATQQEVLRNEPTQTNRSVGTDQPAQQQHDTSTNVVAQESARQMDVAVDGFDLEVLVNLPPDIQEELLLHQQRQLGNNQLDNITREMDTASVLLSVFIIVVYMRLYTYIYICMHIIVYNIYDVYL
ncbi:hypothetical protein RFI_18919 [Reticulomyxa filosa]|uniref:Uncharacterized protein n=1 Tax=Reticulomyxa filosa TaxID=46433 RepID=X6MXZ3_RETFI|nr:hypothetical protein RFI_18919 [Reticulomyxa filosa]|eukprot:ETO18352.1 hypothetical protein RFI_18919 [Reticulomyxa filosa]